MCAMNVVPHQEDSSSGDIVRQKSSHNAEHVVEVSAFGGSIYDSDKTVASASSTREALPSGAKALWIRNNGATNFMRFRFGDSTVTATTTTGIRLNVDESNKFVIPSGATHWAFIADTANVTASVVWS